MDFFAELKKIFETFEKPPEMSKEVIDAYKAYNFDPTKPPSDYELALWATELLYKWHENPSPKLNMPLVGLTIAYNMVTFGKLNQFDQINLKTLLEAVYNMGYNMSAYKMRSPFDKKPQPQDLN